ncbi:MAG: OsmC family protein [Bacteroidales bacterium]|nr:OsmC family protein [Bacteroidales bacterium]
MEIIFAGNKKVFAQFDGFTVQTDQSAQSGGDGEHPEPFSLFLASLGTCAGIYVKYFCDQRGINANGIRLTQEITYDPQRQMIGEILITIHIPPDFPKKYESAVIVSASKCAVKRHLRDDIKVHVITRRSS